MRRRQGLELLPDQVGRLAAQDDAMLSTVLLQLVSAMTESARTEKRSWQQRQRKGMPGRAQPDCRLVEWRWLLGVGSTACQRMPANQHSAVRSSDNAWATSMNETADRNHFPSYFP